MCRTFLFSVSFILVLGVASSASAEVPAGALAIYCFGVEGITDLSGNGRDAILAGDAAISGDVLQLGGKGHLEIPGVCSTCNGVGGYTIYLKNLITTTDWAPIYSVGQDGQENGLSVFTSGGNLLVDLWYGWQEDFGSGVNFRDGTPHEFFLTYSGGTWTVYNGTSSVGSASHSYTVPCGSVWIGDCVSPGQKDDFGWSGLAGTIEAAAVYNRVLSAAEMADLTASICVWGPRMQFASAASGNFEEVSPAEFVVSLSNPEEGQTYTVRYAATGGTATAGVDYSLTAGTLVFNPGETSKTISVAIVDDGVDEGDETIIVTLSNPSGGAELGSIIQHTYTIIDPRPDVEFASQGSTGSEEESAAQVDVVLSHAGTKTVTVAYTVSGGTATGGGVDYTLTPDTLTFSPGQTSKSISIAIIDDDEEEGAETIELTLYNPVNAKLGGYSTHTLTITDFASAPFADSDTVALWLFDETEYPYTTLTDASEYEYDLCLMDRGDLVAGKFGNALRISGSGFTSGYAGFKGSVPIDEMREGDGDPSGVWGPTVAPEKILDALADGNFTCEFWLKLSSTPGSQVSILDIGNAYDRGAHVNLSGGATGFEVEDTYAGFKANCPTNASILTNGQWHHVAFTYNASTDQMRHYLDGQLQATPTVSSVSVQPTPPVVWPSSLDHDSFGFTASSSHEWRRQHRFNITVGHDRQGGMAVNGLVDEVRLSKVIRYTGNFGLPMSFSRNYGPIPSRPAAATGPPLLFPNNSPASLPVQIGSRKHVFIDEVMVASKSNVSLHLNQPGSRQNLNINVLDSSWRASVVDIDNKVYMFIPEGYSSSEGITRLMISQDGVNFTQPNLGVVNYRGSTNNNFVFYRVPFYGSFFKDLNPNVDPAELYKVTMWSANRGIYIYFSPDGIHWRRNEACMLPLVSGGESETFYDDQRGLYETFLKRDSSYHNDGCGGSGRRAIMFQTTEVNKTWPFNVRSNPYFEGWPMPAVTCEGPVVMAPNAYGQVYRTRAMKYPWAPDTYVAFVWRYDDDAGGARQVDLGISRDGDHWNFYAPTWYITPGSDEEVLSLYGLIRRGDQLWHYVDYGGAHGGGDGRIYARLIQRLDGFA